MKTIFCFFCMLIFSWVPQASFGSDVGEEGFRTFVDSRGRFSIKYPATMSVESPTPDELNIFHPSASLRISLDIIKRPKKSSRDTKAFMEAIKRNLKEEFKDSTVLKEGNPSSDSSQQYLVCSFTDKRGVKLTQLTQVYLADEHILQLMITDRPEGFKNLMSVIDRISNSLRILKPSLD